MDTVTAGEIKRTKTDLVISIPRPSQLLLLALSCYFPIQQAESRDWVTEANIGVGAIYSDNICLLANDEEGAFVGTVTPGAKIIRNGSRSSLSMFASVRLNTLDLSPPSCNNSRGLQQGIRPLLRLANRNELVSDWLFLDVNMWSSQTATNPFAPGSSDNINTRDNANNSFRYSVSPYISRRVTRTSDLLLRASYDESFNSRDEVQDSISRSYLFSWRQDPGLTRFSTGITVRSSEVTFKESSRRPELTNELSSAELSVAFRINNRWQLNGLIGEDRNDFVSATDEIDGDYWDVGLLWAPNQRVSVGAGYGERFFGNAPRLDIDYRHKHSSFRLSYNKTVTYQRNLRTSDDFFDGVDDLDPGQTPQDELLGTPTTNTPSPILNERFRARYQFTGRRTTFSLRVNHSEQTRAQDGFTDTFQNVRGSVTRSLRSKLSAVAGIGWGRRVPDESRAGVQGARESETWRYSLSLNRSLADNTQLRLNYTHAQRESDSPGDEYTENRVEVSFRYTF